MSSSLSVTVWITQALVHRALSEAERAEGNETGGVLTGYSTEDPFGSAHIVITDLIGPGPRAAHHPTRFMPDHEWQERELARIYEESGRTVEYLGDWHTHPRALPLPSKRDRATLRRIAAHEEARCPRPLMGIFGQNDDGEPWQLHVVRYQRRNLFARGLIEPAQLKIHDGPARR